MAPMAGGKGRGRGRARRVAEEAREAEMARGRGPPPMAAGGRNLPVMQDEDDEKNTQDELDALEVRSVESGIDSMTLDDTASTASPRQRSRVVTPTEPIDFEPAIIAKKPAQPVSKLVLRPGTQKFDVTTNMFQINMQKNTVLYQYHVEITEPLPPGSKKKHPKIISKGAKDEYNRAMNKQKCYYVFQALKDNNPADFPGALSFDRCKYLISDTQLPNIPPAVSGKLKHYTVSYFDPTSGKPETYNVAVGQVCSLDGTSGVVANDLSCMTRDDLNHRDQNPKSMMETITSQVLFKAWADGGNVFISGNKFIDLSRARDVQGGMSVVPGFAKSVRLARRPDTGAASLVMTIDKKDSAMYNGGVRHPPVEQYLTETLHGINLMRHNEMQHQRIHKALKGLTMKTKHTGQERTFVCEGLFPMNHTIRNKQVTIGGGTGKATLEQYFSSMYGDKVQLKYFTMPPLRGEKMNAYPLEACEIAEYQTVPLLKATPALTKEMIKEGAKVPCKRLGEIYESTNRNRLLSNDILTQFGVELEDRTISVGGQLLPLPQMTMQRPVQLDGYGEFNVMKGGQFLAGGQCSRLALMIFPKYEQGRFMAQHCKQFYDNFVATASKLGMSMPKEPPEVFEQPPIEQLEGMFDYMKARNVDFVLSILPDQDQGIHGRIKWHERRVGVQTQDVLKQTVMKVVEGKQNILYNILMKTNGKTGGVCHEVVFKAPNQIGARFFRPEVAIIGMDINHLTAHHGHSDIGEPSVVGMVMNAGPRVLDLRGEHQIIHARKENQNVNTNIHLMIRSLTDLFVRNRRTLPHRVLFYRDGTSEGQFAHILQTEVPLIRKGLKMLAFDVGQGGGYNPEINMIVCRKTHNERYFRADLQRDDRRKPKDQNLPPGTYIESLHPTDFEFYVQAHAAIQGTAKVPKYTVLLNESNMTADETVTVTNALCYGHQCVSKPVSLPAVVFGAHNYAKRGKMIFNAYKESKANETQDSMESVVPLETEEDYKIINDIIAISNCPTLRNRFNIT